MAKARDKKPQSIPITSSAEQEKAPFRTRNYILFAVGLLVIVAGWFLLRAGHITIAPILLVLGYCGILPLAIVLK
jgi:hypothetical protein